MIFVQLFSLFLVLFLITQVLVPVLFESIPFFWLFRNKKNKATLDTDAILDNLKLHIDEIDEELTSNQQD